MVSTDMAARNESRSNKQFDVFVRLPCGTTAPVAVRYDMTIFELKSMIEFAVGIPAEMQKLSYKQRLFHNDDETLRTCIIIPGVRVNVEYPYRWEELVEASLAGDTKSVINDIYHHFDKSIIARRRFVAAFISSHKGYGFLLERMLSDGMNPNDQTSSGRTALHIAGAMGMMNCIRLLLQHHASVDVQDNFGFTPQKLAERYGQTEVKEKLIQFRRIKNKWDGKTEMRQLPWPLSNNFPKTKLGQSVSPVIDIQQLCITPGPEEVHLYPLPGQRPNSAVVKSAVKLQSPLPADEDSVGNVKKGEKTQNVERMKKNRLDRRPKSAPVVTFCVEQESSIEETRVINSGTRAIPLPSKMNEIDFSKHKTFERLKTNVCPCRGERQAWDKLTEINRTDNMDMKEFCNSTSTWQPVTRETSIDNSFPPNTLGSSNNAELLLHDCETVHFSELPISTSISSSQKALRSDKSSQVYQSYPDVYVSSFNEGSHDYRSLNVNAWVPHVSSQSSPINVSSSHETSLVYQGSPIYGSPDVKLSSACKSSDRNDLSHAYMLPSVKVSPANGASHEIEPSYTHVKNHESILLSTPKNTSFIPSPTSTRIDVDFTVINGFLQDETEEEKRIRQAVTPKFVSEKERFQMKYGKKRATDEENEHAFRQWLALKQQDAKDKKLIRKVKIMLDQVTVDKMEEKQDQPKVESNISASEKAFQDWLIKKKKADVVRRRQENQRAKEYEKRKTVRLGKTFDEWLKDKHKTKSTVRGPLRHEERKCINDEKRTESQHVYNQWLKKKRTGEFEIMQTSRSMQPNLTTCFGKYRNDGSMRNTKSAKPRLKIR